MVAAPVRTLVIASVLLFSAVESIAGPGFPVVSPAEQAARDSDRKSILVDELAEETARYNDAQRIFSAAAAAKTHSADQLKKLEEDVSRHRSNLLALNREIANLGNTGQARPVKTVAAAGAVPAASPSSPVRLTARRREDKEPMAAMASQQTSAPWWDVYRRPQAK